MPGASTLAARGDCDSRRYFQEGRHRGHGGATLQAFGTIDILVNNAGH
ncbi:hypothetical protein ACTMU2_19810 [Cupriavidus basilensis]